jgi:hypothetical protein
LTFNAASPKKGRGSPTATKLIAGSLKTLKEEAEVGAEHQTALERCKGSRGCGDRPRNGIRLARRCSDSHGVPVCDHGLEEGVPVDPVGITKIHQADGSRPHGRAVSLRGDPRFGPGLAEALGVVDELPDGLSDSPDILPSEPLDDVLRIDQLIGKLFAPLVRLLLISVLRPLTSGSRRENRLSQPHRYLGVVSDCAPRATCVPGPG